MKIEYNNLYTHFILTTNLRTPSLKSEHRVRIEKYITGIVNNQGCKMYAIYVNPDHTHFLISRSPSLSEEAVASIVANSSAGFINGNKMCRGRFSWQQSAAAFSISKRDVDRTCKYILSQEEHHKIKSFQEEYDELNKYYQHTLKP